MHYVWLLGIYVSLAAWMIIDVKTFYALRPQASFFHRVKIFFLTLIPQSSFIGCLHMTFNTL